MESLAFYILKSKRKDFPEMEALYAVKKAVLSVIGVALESNQIILRNGSASLVVDPSIKTEIRLKGKLIQAEINKNLKKTISIR